MILKTRSIVLVSFILFTIIYFTCFESIGEITTSQKKACGHFPKAEEIITDNIWQVLETSEGKFHLLNAYLETRFDKTEVLINVNGPNVNVSYNKLYCQFWYESEARNPLIVQVSEYRSLWTFRKLFFELNSI